VYLKGSSRKLKQKKQADRIIVNLSLSDFTPADVENILLRKLHRLPTLQEVNVTTKSG